MLAVLSSSLKNFATEIRELQRPEVGELFEAFERGKQVGSSTIPHKWNPELSECVVWRGSEGWLFLLWRTR